MPTAVDSFGTTLRWWRTTRRYSQLELASDAEVSSRHISFLETGKSHPSREMVVHLATVLDLPLRDRNRLLESAGFASAYPDHELDEPEMDDVRGVLGEILTAHLPNPAVVVDRRGDLIDANLAAFQLIGAIVAEDSPALLPTVNINRLTVHPDGIRDRTENWEDVAANIIQRIGREHAHRPADDQLGKLVEELLAYPDIGALRRHPALPTGADLLVPLRVTTFAGDSLTLVTTIATIGAPYDVTLDELRLETFFPADVGSRSTLRSWSEPG